MPGEKVSENVCCVLVWSVFVAEVRRVGGPIPGSRAGYPSPTHWNLLAVRLTVTPALRIISALCHGGDRGRFPATRSRVEQRSINTFRHVFNGCAGQHAGIEGGWVRDRSANQRPTDHPPGNGAHPATHRSRRHSRGHPVNSSDHLEHQSPVITTGTLLAQNGIPWNAGVANGATNFSEFGKRNELGGWNERTF